MSQRDSGYERIAHDEYPTPAWATEALFPHIPARVRRVWEPACGAGKMLDALEGGGFNVSGTDIQTGDDFFATVVTTTDAIITNPPYSVAQEFIEHALRLTEDELGFVAMLLRCDYDHAKTRRHLFADHPAFSKKLVLTRRIRWIEGSTGSPSFNHAWFCWDHRNLRDPVVAYDFQGEA